jgi:nucleotide-binding universal stress UspA family protein
MKILPAVDGSPISTRAVKHVVKLARQMAAPAELVLMQAEPPLLRRLLPGPVVAKVIAHCDIPVMVVR